MNFCEQGDGEMDEKSETLRRVIKEIFRITQHTPMFEFDKEKNAQWLRSEAERLDAAVAAIDKICDIALAREENDDRTKNSFAP